MNQNISFELVQQIADVSTDHLTPRDCELMGDSHAPNRLAELDMCSGDRQPSGWIFYTPDLGGYTPPEGDRFKEYETECSMFGFSEGFVAIMRAAFQKRIRFVRFDRDGSKVFGIEERVNHGSIQS